MHDWRHVFHSARRQPVRVKLEAHALRECGTEMGILCSTLHNVDVRGRFPACSIVEGTPVLRAIEWAARHHRLFYVFLHRVSELRPDTGGFETV